MIEDFQSYKIICSLKIDHIVKICSAKDKSNTLFCHVSYGKYY